MSRLVVNQERCIACGACIQIDEEHFNFSPAGTSVEISQDNLDSEALAKAIDSCPVGAIDLHSCDECENNCECQKAA